MFAYGSMTWCNLLSIGVTSIFFSQKSDYIQENVISKDTPTKILKVHFNKPYAAFKTSSHIFEVIILYLSFITEPYVLTHDSDNIYCDVTPNGQLTEWVSDCQVVENIKYKFASLAWRHTLHVKELLHLLSVMIWISGHMKAASFSCDLHLSSGKSNQQMLSLHYKLNTLLLYELVQ